MKENQDYKNEGLAALKGHWAQAVVALLVAGAIITVFRGPYLVSVMLSDTASVPDFKILIPLWFLFMGGALLVGGPLTVGFVNAVRRLFRGEGNVGSNMFKIGFGNWAHHAWGYFLVRLFTLLWSLLFWIPGIIKALSYAMTNYILVDYPELSANKAIDLSRAMMKGRKYDLFYLYLSFIGWILLCILTFGIGFLWLEPYISAAQASFYQDVKNDYFRRREMEAAPAPAAAAEPAPVAEPEPEAPVRREENPEDYMPK